MPETRTLRLDQIKPYFRNPRRIPAEAVEGVRTSLEKYGYQQPIVVDDDNVIVVGHTRFAAMQALGVDTVEVYVTDLPEDKVREYRVIDNRTSEMSQWDHSSLVLELREFEEELLAQFFPEVDLEVQAINDTLVTNEDVEKATKKATTVKEAAPLLTTTVECPACFHRFQVRTDSLPGLSRADLEEMANGGPE